jgi:Sulfotransferase domain
MTDTPVRIAMWSGPRNISTAMMRSFSARPDTTCIDEPFYAAYLPLTGLDHPMRGEILAAHSTDAAEIARALTDGTTKSAIVYQKHMTHHMVAGIPRDWMARVRNAFLIRHPARVLASYARKMERVSLEAIGFPQQAELFDCAADLAGQAPAVVDSDDILRDPPHVLAALCADLGINFDRAMLSWAPGPRPEDGAWAPHWYDAVRASTGFAAPPSEPPALPGHLASVLDQAMPIYQRLAAFKLGDG